MDNQFEAEEIEVVVTQKDGYQWRFKVSKAEVELNGLKAVIATDE